MKKIFVFLLLSSIYFSGLSAKKNNSILTENAVWNKTEFNKNVNKNLLKEQKSNNNIYHNFITPFANTKKEIKLEPSLNINKNYCHPYCYRTFDFTINEEFYSRPVYFYLDSYTDLFLGKSLELFSNKSFDNYAFLQESLDIALNVHNTDVCSNHLIELMVDIRTKGIFGDAGKFIQTQKFPIKIGIGQTENEFSTSTDNQGLWVRELWLSYLYNFTCPTSFTIGIFPYQIGCGLILGNAHLVGRTIPGQYYDLRFVDQFRPGVLVSSILYPDRLKFDAYFGIISTKNTDFVSNTEFIRAQEIKDHNKPPVRGSGVSNFFGLAQLFWNVNLNCDRNLTVAPLILVNKDNEQKVEFLGDAISTLGIFGFEACYKSDCIKAHFESAFNFGHQKVKAIDRNIFITLGGSTEQTHLFQEAQCDNTSFFTAATQQTIPEDLGFEEPAGAEFIDANGVEFKNSYNRFRKSYKNTYTGFMAYGDLSFYLRKSACSKARLSFSAGLASGDENPNDSQEKILANRFNTDTGIYSGFNKSYSGFIGIQQMYVCKTVPSVFLLEVRKLNRPLSTKELMLTYPEFTNITFFGAGFTKKKNYENRSLKFSVNCLSYLQPYKTKKGYNYPLNVLLEFNACPELSTEEFLPTLQEDANSCLGRWLSMELNLFVDYKIEDFLKFYVVAAGLIPLNYYNDAKGKFLPLAMQTRLSRPDVSGFENTFDKYNINLGDNTALYFNIGFEYTFDTLFKRRKS